MRWLQKPKLKLIISKGGDDTGASLNNVFINTHSVTRNTRHMQRKAQIASGYAVKRTEKRKTTVRQILCHVPQWNKLQNGNHPQSPMNWPVQSGTSAVTSSTACKQQPYNNRNQEILFNLCRFTSQWLAMIHKFKPRQIGNTAGSCGLSLIHISEPTRPY